MASTSAQLSQLQSMHAAISAKHQLLVKMLQLNTEADVWPASDTPAVSSCQLSYLRTHCSSKQICAYMLWAFSSVLLS